MTSGADFLFVRRARLVGSGVFLLTVGIFMRTPLVVDMADEFRMSPFAVGALASAFALGRLLADLPAGRAVDRFALGSMMATAALIVAVGSVTMATSPGVAVLYVGAFVLGIGSATTLTASFAFFATAPRERRGHYLSLFAAAMLVGQAMGPAAGGSLADRIEWRPTLIVGAIAALVVGAGFLGARALRTESNDEPVTASPDRRGTPLVLLVIYLLPAVQFGIGGALYQTLLPLVGASDFGFSTEFIGLGLAVGGVARLAAALVAGQVSDRIARRAALIPGLILQFTGVMVFALVSTVAGWWATVILLTLGSVVVNVGSTILADLSEGGPLGRRLGAFRMSGDLAFLIMPLLSGALFQTGGRVSAAIPLLVLVATAGLGVVFLVPETAHVSPRAPRP